MSAKKYRVSLTEAERGALLRLSKSQRHSERERKRARILSLADEAQAGGPAKGTAPRRAGRGPSRCPEVRCAARGPEALEPTPLGPMQLLIFGDPRTGTPLMEAFPSLAIDLPLKALAWQDADGQVWLSSNAPAYLRRRHGLPPWAFEAVTLLMEKALA